MAKGATPWLPARTPAGNTASDTCKVLVHWIKSIGFEDAKINHFRKEGVPFAIEIGYVYGEATVRMNMLDGAVDKGTVDTVRGVGDQFVIKATNYIRDCVGRGYIIDPREHGFGDQ